MKSLFPLLSLALLIGAQAHAQSASNYKAPPDVEIQYKISARKNGMPVSGSGQSVWQVQGANYSLSTSARATFFGKIQETASQGSFDTFGLAPSSFYEKRFRKDPTTTSFARAEKKIHFSEGSPSVPLKDGEQDRASVVWQLASLARAQSEKFTPGSEWAFPVAGRRDAETWRFKVIGQEKLGTGMGEIQTLHLSKAPPADSQEQQVDLWLATQMDWYPVKIRYRDADGDFVEQTLDKIIRK